MLLLLRRAAPLLLRHAAAYLALLAADGKLAAQLLRRRVLLTLLGLVSASLSATLFIFLVIVAVWDTPYRLWTIGGIGVLFGLVAAVAVAAAFGGRPQLFRRVKAEWAADRELLPELSAAVSGDGHG